MNLPLFCLRKILKKINPYIKNKVIFIEPKNTEKITRHNEEIYNLKLSENVFVEGYFESEKYFVDIKDKISSEFKFLNEAKYQKSAYFNEISKSNSVSICLRQNRFIEGINRNNELNKKKSIKYTNEQIEYINQSISYIKKNVQKPTFFIWSNDLIGLKDNVFDEKINKVIHDNEFTKNLDKRALDMYLISQCNHHIVIPSSFNWWGAWLSKNRENSLILRPSEKLFSDFFLNLVGLSAWWLVFLSIYSIFLIYPRIENENYEIKHLLIIHYLGFLLLLLSSSTFESGYAIDFLAKLPSEQGGLLGSNIYEFLEKALGYIGTLVFLVISFAIGFSLFTGWSWITISESVGNFICNVCLNIVDKFVDWQDRREGKKIEKQRTYLQVLNLFKKLNLKI